MGLRAKKISSVLRRLDFGRLREGLKKPAVGGPVRAKLDAIDQGMRMVRLALQDTAPYVMRNEGERLLRGTRHGIFLNSGILETYSAFELIGLGRYKKYCSLGSGMGDDSFVASLFGLKVDLMESDPELLFISLILKRKFAAFIPEIGNVSYRCRDYTRVSLGEYDAFYHYADNYNIELLEERFATQCRPGAVFILKTSPMTGFRGNFTPYYRDLTGRIPGFEKTHWVSGLFVYERNEKAFA